MAMNVSITAMRSFHAAASSSGGNASGSASRPGTIALPAAIAARASGLTEMGVLIERVSSSVGSWVVSVMPRRYDVRAQTFISCSPRRGPPDRWVPYRTVAMWTGGWNQSKEPS